MDLEGEEYDDQEYYGASLENGLASAGIVTLPALPPPDHDPIDHTGVGVHVSGVITKPHIVEDSLWGDPLEERNKNKNKKKNDVEDLLCDYHGKVCSRGICKVYEKQLREQQKKSKDSKESQDRRGDGPNRGRGGRGGRGAVRGTRGGLQLLSRGRGSGRDSGPRYQRDGDFFHANFSPVSCLNHSLSQKMRLRKRPMALPPPEMRGPNPAKTPRVTLLGELTTTRGARARWAGPTNPPESPIPIQT